MVRRASHTPALPHSWTEWAACQGIDTEAFYPREEHPRAAEEAKWICGQCPVKRECLRDAIRREDWHGVWGGTTGAERRSVVRQLKRQPALNA
jgi:WhiB family redox-sensing transcriptional regulator